MKPTLALPSLLLLGVPLFVACAGPDLSSDAGDLRDQLSEITGVSDVTLDYSEPVTLDSGKLRLTVTMSDDADPEAVVEVVTTTYDAFADTHHDEEGDLEIAIGDDQLHLRSYQPDAAVDAVTEAATRALEVFPDTIVRAEINTQDVSRAPHVFTRFIVRALEESADAVLAEMARLEEAHGGLPDAAWRVQGNDEYGWLIGSRDGFPQAAQRALFEELAADLPDGLSVSFFDADFVSLRVARGVKPAQVSEVVGRHLRVLADVDDLSYDLDTPAGLNYFGSDGECYFGSDPIGTRLERDHGDRCSTIKHEDDY